VARPDTSAPLVPAFDVLVNGTSLAMDFATHLRELTVDDDLTLPAMFSLELAGGGTDSPVPPWLDDDRIKPAGGVEVKLGYSGALESVFRGEIAAIEADFAGDRPPRTRLRGYDARQRLLRGRHTRTFTASSDSDIVTQIGREAGLSIDAAASNTVHDYVVQADQTDLDFILARAARIGFELMVRGGKLTFRPAAYDGGEAMTLDVAADMLEFAPSLSLAGQVAEVTLLGWNVKDKQVLSSRAAAGDERTVMGGTSGAALVGQSWSDSVETRIGIAPAANQAEADAHAAAVFNATGLALVTAEGLLAGRTDLRAGIVVRITGAGGRFSGAYYVTAVQHRYVSRGGYTTRFAARRNAI
jgi:phage protein D